MKIIQDSFGNTRIYPFVDANATEEEFFISGYVEVLTAQIMKDFHSDNPNDPQFADIRLNMAFNMPVEATRWQVLCEAMEKAFEIQSGARNANA